MYGTWRHGYANYDEMRKDPEYSIVFTGKPALTTGEGAGGNAGGSLAAGEGQASVGAAGSGPEVADGAQLKQEPQGELEAAGTVKQEGEGGKGAGPQETALGQLSGLPQEAAGCQPGAGAGGNSGAGWVQGVRAVPGTGPGLGAGPGSSPSKQQLSKANSSATPGAEPLTKRYRKLLDMIPRAQVEIVGAVVGRECWGRFCLCLCATGAPVQVCAACPAPLA